MCWTEEPGSGISCSLWSFFRFHLYTNYSHLASGSGFDLTESFASGSWSESVHVSHLVRGCGFDLAESFASGSWPESVHVSHLARGSGFGLSEKV
jgi:hypothetical protein